MSAPGGRTEIFDFEAGDASEARVYIRAILGGGWTCPPARRRLPQTTTKLLRYDG